MVPLILSFFSLPPSSPSLLQVVNGMILGPMLATGDFPWALGWYLRKLVKHKPPTAVRVYLWGLQVGGCMGFCGRNGRGKGVWASAARN